MCCFSCATSKLKQQMHNVYYMYLKCNMNGIQCSYNHRNIKTIVLYHDIVYGNYWLTNSFYLREISYENK